MSRIYIGISNIEKQKETLEEKKSSFDPYLLFNQDFLDKIKLSENLTIEQSQSQQAEQYSKEENDIEQVFNNL